MDTIRQHAEEFIAKREAPAYIANDGKQTPMRGGGILRMQLFMQTGISRCICRLQIRFLCRHLIVESLLWMLQEMEKH